MTGETLARGVLSALLDKYENSEAFRKGEPTQARIQLRFTDALVKGYGSGRLDPDDRAALHTALLALADRGFIELKWVKFEEGNILERVYLDWDLIADVYGYLGRTPQREKLAEFTSEMEAWLQNLLGAGQPELWGFLIDWVEDIRSFVRERGRIPSSLVPEDRGARSLLLRAVAGLIRKRDRSVPVRLFSKQELGNSKVFEKQVQSHVVRLVRRYWSVAHPLDVEAPDDDATLLRELGLESGHDDITFCGPVRFRYVNSRGPAASASAGAAGDNDDGGGIDASVFPYGLAVDASDVHRIEITDASISRVVTIENKANYRAYVREGRQPDEFVIYLGGFASPAQREFLRLLRRFLQPAATGAEPTTLAMNGEQTAEREQDNDGVEAARAGTLSRVALHHWGDLDYGGILILQSLRNSCWPEAVPWRMEPELLDEYIEYAEQIDEGYRAKLERLLESDVYAWAHPLIREILKHNAVLEQEALLVDE